MNNKANCLIPVLSVAGSDCSGGAGIQADLKTFSAHGLFGMSVIVSVVAENTMRVTSVLDVDKLNINNQFACVFEDITPQATKIGMLGSIDAILSVKENLLKYKARNIVIDPVMYAKNGFPLMPEHIRNIYKKEIITLADLITPNIPEAQELTGIKITNLKDMQKAAKSLYEMSSKYVLLKGGHLDLEEKICHDVLFDSKDFHIFSTPKIESKNTHGTGCTMSSAIASNLALGFDIVTSVKKAKDYVYGAIVNDPHIGKGCGAINHLWNVKTLNLG